MAFEQILQHISIPAGSDLSTKQYYAVSVNASGQLALTAVGVNPDGILQNKPDAATKIGTVAVFGISKVAAGAAITNGDVVAVDSTGRAVTATTAKKAFGKALAAAAAAGDIIPVLLKIGPADTL